MADEPTTEILDTTYHALCKYDYSNLTFQDIAAADTRTGSVHYDDSRDQLFGAFLDELCEFYSTTESVDKAEYLTRPEAAQ